MAGVVAACGGGSDPAPTTPANQSPTVTLDAPAANAVFQNGETIRITATAADSGGTVAKVEFLSDGAKIGEDTSAPFAFDWVNPPTGTHKITVRATDNAGAATLSGERQVTTKPVNQLPTVSMAAPSNNFKADENTTVVLSANAADTDGSIANVQFFKIDPAAPVFNDTTFVGEGTAVGSPASYQFTTAALAAGQYDFAAKAIDNDGGSVTSGTVHVIINALPTISLTSPTAGQSAIAPSTLTLKATATDADGSITTVEFFLDGSTTALGTGTKAGNEYSLAWTVTAGPHSFTARATDNDGSTATTASVAINVANNVPPTVTLDNPAATRLTVPATLQLSASASDSDGSVASVQFFNGAASLGNGTFDAVSSKWKLSLPVNAAATFTITAKATDNLGGQTTTASKGITIQANVPPTVNITSSAAVTLDEGNAPKNLVLTAAASDSDDGIAKVEFFNGAAKLGEATSAPYQFAWNAVAANSYTITAKATDNVGTTTTSAPQALVVTPDLRGPWSTLSTAQKGGIVLAPNRSLGDPGVDAGAVMTAIGVNTVAPKYVSAMAQGLRKLADLPLAVTGTTLGEAVACPEGGTIAVFQLAGGERAIDLIDCKIGGYVFHGGGDFPIDQTYTESAPDNQCTPNGGLPPTVPPAAPRVCTWPSEVKYTPITNGFRIVVKTVQVSGNGTPEKLNAPFPHNAYGFGYVQCTITNGVKSCLTSHENSFVWGNDLAWTNWEDNLTTAITTPLNLYATDDKYTLNGTLRPCEADPQEVNATPAFCQDTPPAAFHIKFDAMTVDGKTGVNTASGRAIVYADNGWSIVTRLPHESPGVERVTVHQKNLDGSEKTPLRTYRCPVDSNGFYVCALVP